MTQRKVYNKEINLNSLKMFYLKLNNREQMNNRELIMRCQKWNYLDRKKLDQQQIIIINHLIWLI
jgi:hypothetical protein